MTDPAGIGTPAYVAQTGTFSNNPISTSAALACIDVLEREGTYESLFAKGNKLMLGLRDKFAKAGIPVQVCGEAPAFQVWFSEQPIVDFRSMQQADRTLNNRFTELLLDRGIVKAHEKFFVSLAHTDEDLDYTLAAFDSVIEELVASA